MRKCMYMLVTYVCMYIYMCACVCIKASTPVVLQFGCRAYFLRKAKVGASSQYQSCRVFVRKKARETERVRGRANESEREVDTQRHTYQIPNL